ncbi:MAG TPA: Do family serine endopeptidase [Candidatus Paceibacterota bacterium]|nr:Do family serine endopeptidase [Candidatus Paceibacterota bacterium]
MNKRISKPVLSLASAVVGGVLVFGLLQTKLLGREPNNPPPKFNIQDAPINRDARGVTSYSPVIKRAAPSVVNIYSTRTVKLRRMPMNPFIDPFHQFFGDDGADDQQDQLPAPNRRGGSRRGGNGGQTMTQQSLGSGVIVSPEGYILTANHVVEGADPDGVKVSLASGGKEIPAKIVGTDPQTDVAVLKIDGDHLQPITLADSDKIEVGDVVMAIGNPFGVGQTVTMGIVSATGRTSLGIIRQGTQRGYENFIQTDAAINQGNSGGALIDAEGRLIGINTAIFSPSGGNAGIGFAVPVNMARYVMERLITSGKVTRGYLGVNLQPEITSGLAKAFNLPDQKGAMVGDVMPNTPASRAGLKNGDVIRELNGKPITDSDQLRLSVSQMAPGSKVTLLILRSEPGRRPVEKTVNATLGTLPGDRNAKNGEDNSNDQSSSTHDSLDGVEVADIDANTRHQLNIPENVQGALVSNVDPDSNSAQAGLRRGDVILEIDRKPVHNANEAVDASEKATNDVVSLRIWRDGASMYLTVENEKKK